MQLDDNFKKLIKELGNAINDSLADSESIADVIARIRASGYELFLVLEVTIGFNKRGEGEVVQRRALEAAPGKDPEFRLTNQDNQFLRSLNIRIEEETK
ncbi:MAG: hypothetical protein ACM3NO_06790 [Deltaproteobacteria bacterium]